MSVVGEASIQQWPVTDPVRSLVWDGDNLVDWVGGGARWLPDGTAEPSRVFYAYAFDRVVVSPSGAFVVLYAERGTKGIVLNAAGQVIREINRSFYQAHVYEYPIALVTLPDGREVIAHCPDGYDELVIETVADGERLTGDHEGSDSFQSRLAFSPDGRWLASAGWLWHPVGVATVYDVQAALADAAHFAERGVFGWFELNSEVESVCWVDSDRIAVSMKPDEELFDDDPEETQLGLGELGVWSLSESRWVSRVLPTVRVGTLHPLADGLLSLYGHPKIIDPASGAVVAAWPELSTGTRDSSICDSAVPPVAVHPAGDRFAVASEEMITAIHLG